MVKLNRLPEVQFKSDLFKERAKRETEFNVTREL